MSEPMPEILPCPKCGSSSVGVYVKHLNDDNEPVTNHVQVVCQVNACQFHGKVFQDYRVAISEWNVLPRASFAPGNPLPLTEAFDKQQAEVKVLKLKNENLAANCRNYEKESQSWKQAYENILESHGSQDTTIKRLTESVEILERHVENYRNGVTATQSPAQARPSPFDYIRYDAVSTKLQRFFKQDFESLYLRLATYTDCRYKFDAQHYLELAYSLVGKLIRDNQLERNGSAPLQEGRSDS